MKTEHPVDFRIARNGTWFHDGEEIKRAALAKLFSDRALIIDDDGHYWLKTPYEQYPVEVEDVPFVIVDYEEGKTLTLITNMDETLELKKDTAWELRDGIPYVEVRSNLFARLGRAVLYNLIEQYGEVVVSDGQEFPLGEIE